MSVSKPVGAARRGLPFTLEAAGPTILVLAGVALGLLAFRDVLAFEPHRPHVFRVDGAEGQLFTPQGGGFGLFHLAAAWLVWRHRAALRPLVTRERIAASGPLLLLAGLLYGWACYVGAELLLFYTAPVLLLGLGVLLAGASSIRVLWRPALLFLVVSPLPGVLLNAAVYALQRATIRATDATLWLAGFDTARAGDLLFTSQGTFQVIETCSGMGIITTSVATAILYTELFETSRLRTLLLLAAAPLVGFAANILRVLSLVFHPNAAGTVMHEVQGLVMIVVAVLAIAGVDALLVRLEPARKRARGRAAPRSGLAPGRRPLRSGVALLPGVTLLLALTSLVLPRWEPAETPSGLPHLPRSLGEWRSSLASPDHLFLGSVGFSEQAFRRYERGDDAVEVLVGANHRLDPQTSLLSPKIAYPGSGWTRARSAPFELPSGESARASLFHGPEGWRLGVHWREGVDSLAEESLRALLALDRGPLRRPGSARVVRLTTPIDPRAGGVPAAEQRVRELSRHLLPVLAGEEPPARS